MNFKIAWVTLLLSVTLTGCLETTITSNPAPDGTTTTSAPSVPTLSYSGAAGTTGQIGTLMSVAPTTLAANGASISACAIKGGTTALPGWASINASTCVISGTPTSGLVSTTYTIVATNSVGVSTDATVQLSVDVLAPTSVSMKTPAATTGNNITPTVTVSGGSVANGVTVSLHTNSTCTAQVASGTASGTSIDLTASALADNSYTFFAKTSSGGVNSSCSTASASYALDTVAPTVSSVAVYNGTSIDVTFSKSMGTGVTTANNYTVSGAGQGTFANHPNSVALVSGFKYRLTWTSGLMVNGGNITIAVSSAQDLAGNAVSSSGTHTGGGTAPTISYTSSTLAIKSRAVSLSPTATAGNGATIPGTNAYSLVSGSLPAGVTLNANTGVLSGTPTVYLPSTGYVIRLTTSIGQTVDSSSFTLTVAEMDDSVNSFAGGTHSGTTWSTNKLVLDSTQAVTNSELDNSWTDEYGKLVGYWKLNGSLGAASSGSSILKTVGSNGSVDNTGVNYVAGKLGQGMSFSSGQVSLPTSSTPTLPITIMFWAHPNTSTPIGMFDSAPGMDHVLRNYPAGVVEWLNNDWLAHNEDCQVSLGLTANQWVHLVFVFSTDNSTYRKIEWYKNGVAQTGITFADTTNFSADWSTLRLGNINGAAGLSFDGVIDDFAVFSGQALTSTEVTTIYNRQSPAYQGTFTSRVIDYTSAHIWSGLQWLTTLPFGKELMGGGTSESSSNYSSLTGSTGSTADNNLMSGIVGIWHMNDTGGTTLVDSSGSGNNASKSAGTLSSVSGVLDHAINFDGSTYATITHNSGLDLSTAWTIQAWVKQSANNGQYSGFLTDKITGHIQYCLGYCTSTSVISAALYSGGWYASPTYQLVNGDWTHVVGTYNGSATSLKLYINGQLVGTNSAAPASVASDGLDKVIARRWDAASYFNGSIDELALWNRTLRDDEVLELYRRGANRVKHQVRTCAANDCSDNPTWLGPDNSASTYFSELQNNSSCSSSGTPTGNVLAGSPSLNFNTFSTALPSRQYFQYRTVLETDDRAGVCSSSTTCSPELKSIILRP